jgi:hypothetical protein
MLEDEDQGRQGQTLMGLAHDRDVVHSTEDGTMLMQATVWQDPSSQTQLQCMCTMQWGIPCPLGSLYKRHQGEQAAQSPEEAHSLSLYGSSPS